MEVLSQSLFGTGENHKTSVRIAGVPAEIRIKHLPTTGL
jgi:hypothetical protein